MYYAADYDGTDIGKPYLVDNSTGTPVYKYLDDENYHPPTNRPKRGATANRNWLWPLGVVTFSLYSDLTGTADFMAITEFMYACYYNGISLNYRL